MYLFTIKKVELEKEQYIEHLPIYFGIAAKAAPQDGSSTDPD